jgi:ribonuclease P protein component
MAAPSGRRSTAAPDHERPTGRETDLPAQYPQTSQDPWLPRPHGDQRRQGDPAFQAAQGAASPDRLSEMTSRKVGSIRRGAVFVALRRPAGRGSAGPVRVSWVPRAEGDAFPLVGYAIGRRCGNAVQRNRLRRRLRAAVEQHGPGPGSYLVTADASAVGLEFAELVSAVGSAMSSATTRGNRP